MRDIQGSDWLQTRTGKAFFLFDARPEDFDIVDIAHALSMQCRYNGHCNYFYSVAQHSIYVMQCLRDFLGVTDVDVLRCGLLHDGAEAYIGDMVRPLKRKMPSYKDAEEKIERAMAERFGLPWPFPPIVKRADNIVLACERDQIMGTPPRSWNLIEDPWADLTIESWSPQAAATAFMLEADILEAQR